MRRRLWLMVLIAATPVPLLAQDAAPVFFTHGLAWTPTIAVRDFGYDTNINSTPSTKTPDADVSATLNAGVDGVLNLTRVKLSGSSVLDLIYFERTRENRAFNRRLNGRAEFPLKAFVPYVAMAHQRLRDRATIEIDRPQRHTERDLSAGTNLLFFTRAVIQLTARRQETLYDQDAVVRGIAAAPQLNHRDDGGTLAARVTLTPFTSLTIDAGRSRSSFPLNPLRTQWNTTSHVALDFAPDAVIHGSAGMGWHTITAADPDVKPSNGATVAVDLGYVLLGVTRFDGRINRDTTVSIEAPYYRETAYGLDVLQTFIGASELIARYNRTIAEYTALPAKGLAGRLDITDTIGGGVAFRMGKGTRMTINYEYSKRQSDLDLLTYNRQRVFTSVSLGL
jgi:hypothetical protein